MSATPEAALAAALDHMREPFSWGGHDCLTAACGAFQALHGIDPLAGYGQPYGSLRAAARIVRAGGGYEACCREQFAVAGLIEVGAPEAGDLAVVTGAPEPFGIWLGLCVGEHVAIKADRGVRLARIGVRGGWTCRRS